MDAYGTVRAASVPRHTGADPDRRCSSASGSQLWGVRVQPLGRGLHPNMTYGYGMTVVLRGRVNPAHADLRASVLRRNPYSSKWRRVATVPIAAGGRMRYSWHTTYEDAVQHRPYWFRFNIPGHGKSNDVQAWVIFGE